ncbi:MAG: hypothetical protein ACK5KN_04195 [Dysgonomonas sp.]|uniref:hypothetical protein n=1 Tax=Dysgonomonas sp. TaxID=1891233 RepID=UPI003A84A119
MEKKDILHMAQIYSKNKDYRDSYIAGFQAACSIIFQKYNSCYNEEFCDEMEALSEVCFMEFD